MRNFFVVFLVFFALGALSTSAIGAGGQARESRETREIPKEYRKPVLSEYEGRPEEYKKALEAYEKRMKGLNANERQQLDADLAAERKAFQNAGRVPTAPKNGPKETSGDGFSNPNGRGTPVTPRTKKPTAPAENPLDVNDPLAGIHNAEGTKSGREAGEARRTEEAIRVEVAAEVAEAKKSPYAEIEQRITEASANTLSRESQAKIKAFTKDLPPREQSDIELMLKLIAKEQEALALKNGKTFDINEMINGKEGIAKLSKFIADNRTRLPTEIQNSLFTNLLTLYRRTPEKLAGQVKKLEVMLENLKKAQESKNPEAIAKAMKALNGYGRVAESYAMPYIEAIRAGKNAEEAHEIALAKMKTFMKTRLSREVEEEFCRRCMDGACAVG